MSQQPAAAAPLETISEAPMSSPATAPVPPACAATPGAFVEPAPAGETPAAPESLPERRDRRKSDQACGGVERRNNIVDRRSGLNRRVVDIGSPTGLERRRGPGCRRNADRKSAEEGEMTDEQFEFVMAIDMYKRLNGRPFPTWTEVLEVLKQLGYRKVAACTIKLPNNNGRATQNEKS